VAASASGHTATGFNPVVDPTGVQVEADEWTELAIEVEVVLLEIVEAEEDVLLEIVEVEEVVLLEIVEVEEVVLLGLALAIVPAGVELVIL